VEQSASPNWMNIETFNKHLRKIDHRLFVHKDRGKWRVRRTELRFFPWFISGKVVRIGFRNRNLAAAHKVMILDRLNKSALYRMYYGHGKRFSVIRQLNDNDRQRNEALARQLRSRVALAASYLANRNKLIIT
jgi:hypothetical protein